MLFDPSSVPHLKPWLVRTLEPICDAEPGALAEYILALLKHNVPEPDMRKELAVQLEEFLEKECTPFIDTLFTVLRTKSYLPYNTTDETSASFASKPQDNGIPIPLDGLLAPTSPSSPESKSRKRGNDNDDQTGQRPAKGPRLNEDSHFPRYGDGRGEGRLGGGWGARGGDAYRDNSLAAMNGFGMMNMGAFANAMGMNGMLPMGMGMNGRRPQQAYQPPDQKRGVCRDYYNNGYCARGAMCKYSHGEDAMIPAQLYSGAGGMPFMPMFPGAAAPFGVSGAAYDPHEARMDMRPSGGRLQQRAPLLPRTQQEDGKIIHTSGELPVIQDLTPSAPHDEMKQADGVKLISQPTQQTTQTHPMTEDDSSYGINGLGGMVSMNGQSYTSVGTPMDVDGAGPSGTRHGGFRGGRGGRGGRGTFGGEVHNFRPQKRNDKTLVVEKIPDDKLSLEQVNAWFKRFGTVTNVAIDAMGSKALVSFSNHEEAHAAWKSEDAVFNNRFVKVFWHRPLEGHGEAGKRMLAASAPLVANMSAKETTTPLAGISVSKSANPSRKFSAAPSATASILAAKQELLEKQIAEQKSLMASLETATPAEKKNIMGRLRKLGEEMKAAPATTPPALTASPAPSTAKKSTFDATEIEKKEREKLDRELEMHSATADGEESAEDLKVKLEKLKAEAASLGIPDGASDTSYSAPYRGFRGRVRGGPRGHFRGAMRGGPPSRGSMKLDNRPKKLLLKGASESDIQNIHDWYETTGQLDTVEHAEGGGIIVSFKSRPGAEQGLAKGSNIPTVGSVQITWYTGKPSTTSTAISTSTISKTEIQISTNDEAEHVRPRSPEPAQSHPHEEEEIVASGWGGGDDEDGMGML
ncbi:hypothetical protein BDQ17DRAFT_1340220 [Cyathus striatus]|nr:hypothetical protein BDQ17DRAFT_1340220 [Cyathus striatus]